MRHLLSCFKRFHAKATSRVFVQSIPQKLTANQWLFLKNNISFFEICISKKAFSFFWGYLLYGDLRRVRFICGGHDGLYEKWSREQIIISGLLASGYQVFARKQFFSKRQIKMKFTQIRNKVKMLLTELNMLILQFVVLIFLLTIFTVLHIYKMFF